MMVDLAEECLRILNEGHFQIVEPGPLHTPIHGFSIRRDEKLTLILETEVPSNATSAAIDHPPGMVRMSTESARLRSIGGVDAELVGVIPFSLKTRSSGVTEHPRKEESRVHIARTHFGGDSPATYVIDWLENLPASPFVWPATSRVVTKTTPTRTISLDDGITIAREIDGYRVSHNTAKLTVEGTTFYLCALGFDDNVEGSKRGCIVFDGMPDDGFRKKIRTALSFALGLYLVDLGTTHYNRDWHIVSTLARSAYSLGRRAFDMGPDQLAPLGPRYRNELNPGQLNRAVTALVSAFDELDLANLSWAYWHACAATPHIAPAHFGAAVEALQNAYIKAHPSAVPEGWAPGEVWAALRASMAAFIEGSNISNEAKAALTGKLATFNAIDQRPSPQSRDVSTRFGVGARRRFGLASSQQGCSWHAGSGRSGAGGDPGHELLRGLFNRLLLRITNAADEYIDYTSPNFEYRPLESAPPDASLDQRR